MQIKQLTLGELIEKLENLELTYGEDKSDKNISFDFGTAIPTKTDSWRGDYSHIALGYELTGYDHSQNYSDEITAKALLEVLKSSVGATFAGWKGGDFTMGEETLLWVSNPGNASCTGIYDIIDQRYMLTLATAQFDY